MTYVYRCIKCDHEFDVIKPVRDIDVNEYCPSCEAPAERQFVPTKVHLIGTSVQNAEYNPGLGCVVKNKQHREEIAKRRGLVEIGSDFKSGASMQNHFDKTREEKHEKEWKEL